MVYSQPLILVSAVPMCELAATLMLLLEMHRLRRDVLSDLQLRRASLPSLLVLQSWRSFTEDDGRGRIRTGSMKVNQRPSEVSV